MGSKRLVLSIFCGFVMSGHVALAQETDPGEPLSAIDWLSEVVRNPPRITIPQEDVTTNALPTSIVTTTLDAPNVDAVGILSRGQTGLPADFWGSTPTLDLIRAIDGLRNDLPRPLLEFLQEVMLTELTPPFDGGGRGDLFLARIDWFLKIGALEQAEALLLRAGPKDDPRLFSRWFDVSLLTAAEEAPCRHMLRSPDLAPTYPARIFCLARSGDWDAAVLTLNTGRSIGLIGDQDDALLARFLDPALFEGAPFLPIPERITPLNYRMHEAIGEPLSLGGLPNAFAFASLSEKEGWKARITAAERLARATAIPPSRLAAIYSERSRAASGGAWDRVEAWQDVAAALEAADPEKLSDALPTLLRAARRVGLEPTLSELIAPELGKIEIPDALTASTSWVGLMSADYEAFAGQATDPLIKSVATGVAPVEDGDTPLRNAVVAAFRATKAPPGYAEMIAKRELGAAFLKAAMLFEDGRRADPASIETALTVFRALSLTDLSRRMALFLLLMENKP